MKLTIILSFICLSLFSQRIRVVNELTGETRDRDFPSKTNVIPKLEDHIKIYIIKQMPRPAYDDNMYKLEPVEYYTDSIGEGNNYPYLIKDWSITILEDDQIRIRKELEVAQKQAELLMNSISDTEFKQKVVVILGLLLYERQGNTLNAKQEQKLSDAIPFAIKAYQNDLVKERLLQDLQTNPFTDIDSGWVK